MNKKGNKYTTRIIGGYTILSGEMAEPQNWFMSHVCDPTSFEPNCPLPPEIAEAPPEAGDEPYVIAVPPGTTASPPVPTAPDHTGI